MPGATATGDVSVDPQSFARLRFDHLIRSTGSGPDDEVETYHDRIRETVSARLDAPVRAAHHRRLALSMESHGDADAETVAVQPQPQAEVVVLVVAVAEALV